jgi:nitroreductase
MACHPCPVEFREVLRRRRMVRQYDQSRRVPAEVVERLVAAAVRAPSAGFSQGWGFLVLDEPEDIARFREAVTPDTDADQWFAAQVRAPLIIVPHSNKDVYLDRYATARQGLHRPVRGLVVGAVLGHRRRVRLVADPADRRRRRAGGLLLRDSD